MAYEFQEYPKYLYHPTLAPSGKVFNTAAETKGLAEAGWVGTPADFPKPSALATKGKAFWQEWEWSFKALAVVLGIALATIALVKACR